MTPRPSLSTVLRTQRLLLRPPSSRDVGKLRAAFRKNESHLQRWNPIGETSLTAVIERTERQRAEWRRGFRYQFYLFEEMGGPVLGGVSLSEIQRGPMLGCNLGYWVDSDHQGKGLVREAVHRVLSFGFDVVGLHRVQAGIMPENRRSLAVAGALGFRLEGLALRYLCVRGVWEDHQIFAMTREEWVESPQPAV